MGNSAETSGGLAPLNIDLARAELAVDWLPRPDKEFRAARHRWMNIVRASRLLTGAERQIGLAIAQEHINRQAGHQWFNWAWPSHQTLANETGLSRRTVVAGVKRLAMFGFLVIAHGGGRMGRGGRTDRYTLRMDRLELLAAHVASRRAKGVKEFHALDKVIGDIREESCASRGGKVRNFQHEDVKGLHKTLLGNQLEDSVTELLSLPTTTQSLPSKGKKGHDPVTSADHSTLAECVGDGDLAAGWERLQAIPEDDVGALALRLRNNPTMGAEIRCEVYARCGRVLS